MADRIFPSAKQDSLGNEKQINTIDWDVFAKNFKFAAEEDDETPKKENGEKVKVSDMTVSELESAIKDSDEYKNKSDEVSFREFCEDCPEDADCKPHCEEWLKKNPESDEDDDDNGDDTEEASDGKMAKAAKKHPSPFIQEKIDKQKMKGPDTDGVDTKNMPPALKKYHEDKKSSKPEESKVVRAKDVMCEKCAGKGCDACWDMKKKASSEGRVIVFNNPSEISAEALMAAKTAGDDVKVRAILAARETRNRVIEAKLESLAQEEVSKAQKLAQRREAREAIIAQADASVQRVASTEAKIAKANKQEGFKKVSSMQNNEKMIVAQRLLDNGFPKEYVEATLGLTATAEAVVTLEETHIREIMASSLNENTKRTAVASFVKVAELSQEQLDRCIRFWVDELGYGDEAWVRDLFAKK